MTRASGKKSIVLARTPPTAASAPRCTCRPSPRSVDHREPGPTTRYAAGNIGHHAALPQLANPLVVILHGCLKTCTLYNQDTAWAHHLTTAVAS